MRGLLRALGVLLFGVAVLAFGVFGGFLFDTYGPDMGGLTLNRVASDLGLAPPNEVQAGFDGEIYVQEVDGQIRFCRLANEETLEAECGPWVDAQRP